MNYSELDTAIFSLSRKETLNLTNIHNDSLVVNQETVFIDTLNYFNIKDNKYHISLHNRFKSVPPHTHSVCEISYIYHGEVEQWIDGKFYTFTAGDVLVLDSMVPHAIKATSTNDIMVNLLTTQEFFTANFISKFIKESLIANIFFSVMQNRNKSNYLIFHTGNNPHIKQTIQNMLLESYEPKTGSSEIIQAYMLIFFGELLRSTKYNIHNTFLNIKNNVYIVDILLYIERNYEDGTLKSAADYFSISPVHLSRLLKEHVGKSFKQLVHDKRIAVAYELLISTSMPIYSIVEKVGYSNHNTFNQQFKKRYHCLPGAIGRTL